MSSSESSASNTESKEITYNPPHHPEQQKKTHCIKNSQLNKSSNLHYQADWPWHLDPPADDIEAGNGIPQHISPLLTLLPPEINNMIYKLVLDRDSTANSKGQINISSAATSRHCHCDDCDRTQDALLLTCREVYHHAAGMAFGSELPFRFQGSETILKFLRQMSPRRQEGIQHLIIALDEPTDSLEELVAVLRVVYRLPRLVRLEVQIRYKKVFHSDEKTMSEVKCELKTMVRLEYFAIQILHDRVFFRNSLVRRATIHFVKEMCRAVPCMRDLEPVVKGYLVEEREGD